MFITTHTGNDTGDGYTKAMRRVPKDSDLGRVSPNTIVTIDFGTTWCSVAYLTEVSKHDTVPSRMDPVLLELDEQGHTRVPNCILFDQHGVRNAFGYQAREQYASKKKELRNNCAYFEKVKKNVQQEEVSRITTMYIISTSRVE